MQLLNAWESAHTSHLKIEGDVLLINSAAIHLRMCRQSTFELQWLYNEA